MKYIKLIILAAFLSTSFTGCSYVSDMVEGAISKRASFGVTAVPAGSTVTLSWDKTDSSLNFAGIEIYVTTERNDEYANYELVASRHYAAQLNTSVTDLETGSTTTCNVDAPATPGIYFYRVGFIHIDNDPSDVPYDASNSSYYNSYTNIDAISGYARVVIP